MKRLLLACILLLSVFRVNAGPADDALLVVQRWAKAFSDSDVDTIVSLYSPDALFFGTGSKTLVTTPQPIRTYFEQALLSYRPRGAQLREHSVHVLSDTAVVVTGLDGVSGTRDGNVITADGRVTFVLEKRGAGWQIAHFHRSALPN